MKSAKGANATRKRSKNGDGSKKIKLLVVVLVILLIGAVGGIIYLLTRTPDKPEDNRATIVTEDNVDEVMKQLNEPVEAGYYNCQMNVDWNFTDSKQPSYNAYVVNSDINTHTVYFDVNLEEDNKLVFSSPYIPVGEELKEIKLSEELSAGDYPAVVTYHLVDDEHEELSTVSVTVTLHIEQ